jgi:hypothetical protein
MLHIVLVYIHSHYTYSPYNFVAEPLLSCTLIIFIDSFCLVLADTYIQSCTYHPRSLRHAELLLSYSSLEHRAIGNEMRADGHWPHPVMNSNITSEWRAFVGAWRVKGSKSYVVCHPGISGSDARRRVDGRSRHSVSCQILPERRTNSLLHLPSPSTAAKRGMRRHRVLHTHGI